MKLLTKGSWNLISKKDSRWNCHGCGSVGGLVIPPDAKVKIAELKKELDCDPPDDLEYSYMKY